MSDIIELINHKSPLGRGTQILFLKLVIFIIIFILIVSTNQYVSLVASVLLCFWTLAGPRDAIRALSLNYMILLLNPAISNLPSQMGIIRWLILFLAGLRVLPMLSLRVIPELLSLMFFYFTVLILAWLGSPNFLISFLKITIFTYCVATVIVAYDAMDEVGLRELQLWFFSLSAAVIFLSVPTFLFPGIGYFRNGTGFQGILNHPQTFGCFLAPVLACWATYCLSHKLFRSPWISAVVLLTSAMLVFSMSRTAILAFIMSLSVAFISCTVRDHYRTMSLSHSRKLPKLILGCLLIALIAASPLVSQQIAQFWLKGDEKTFVKAFEHSRGAGIAFHWKRFLQKPLTGCGFGIDASNRNDEKPGTFLGIPVSASTEKGFLPMAFMEEVGLLGLVSFIPFLLLLTRRALSQEDIGLIATFFACLFVNVGEAVFFSPGLLGGYFWLLIGLSIASNWQPKSKEAPAFTYNAERRSRWFS